MTAPTQMMMNSLKQISAKEALSEWNKIPNGRKVYISVNEAIYPIFAFTSTKEVVVFNTYEQWGPVIPIKKATFYVERTLWEQLSQYLRIMLTGTYAD